MNTLSQNESVMRKPGRPKGSKNKTKAAAPAEAKAVAKLADVAQHVRTFNELSKKLDHNERKSDDYMRSMGQCIAAIKKARPDDWKEVVKTQCKLERSRAYDLLAIADGTKTPEQVRAANAKRVSEHRKKIRYSNGQPASAETPAAAEPQLNAVGKPYSKSFDPDYEMKHKVTPISRLSPIPRLSASERAAIKDEGNVQAPIDMGARLAEIDAKETVEEAEAAMSAAAESRDPKKYQDTLYNKVLSLVGTMDEETRKRLILHLVDKYGRPDDYPDLPDSLRRA